MKRVLLDTSVSLRLFDEDASANRAILETVDRWIDEGDLSCIAPQVIYEMRVVLTRPKADNGQGKTAAEFTRLVERLSALASLLPDPPDLVQRWLELCETHQIVGKRSHDARLVAWMLAHGVDTLLTLNPRDFAAFTIEVRTP